MENGSKKKKVILKHGEPALKITSNRNFYLLLLNTEVLTR